MTTPQNELHNLSYRIKRLTDLFEPNENDEDIFDTVKQMQKEMLDVINSQIRLENQMNLIIKLLGKSDE